MLPDIRIHKLILLRQTYKKNKDDIKPGSLISSFISIKCKSLIKINKHVLFVFPYPQSLPIAPNLRIFNHLTRIIPTITPVLFVFPPIYSRNCGLSTTVHKPSAGTSRRPRTHRHNTRNRLPDCSARQRASVRDSTHTTSSISKGIDSVS